jgi:AcrR family transcriptional regulator
MIRQGRKPERTRKKMYETFEKLPESRKEQVLQVCIEEFARNGYKNASTNTIVKRLGISKGLLFLYFTSKKDLYLYLIDYLILITVDDFFHTTELNPKMSIDVFNILGEYYKTLFLSNPDYLLLLLEAFMSPPPELKEEIEIHHHGAHDHILEHINTDGFRKGIDMQAVVNLLHLATFHVGQLAFDYRAGDVGNIEEKIDECLKLFNKYIDIIKYGVYERTE